MKILKKLYTILLAVVILSASGCSDSWFDTEDSSQIYNPKAKSLLIGAYGYMNQAGNIFDGHDDFGYMSIMLKSDLMSEDMALQQSTYFIFDYKFDYWASTYVKPAQDWTFFYGIASKANSIIDIIDLDTEDPDMKAYLGQAYALRGMAYFYLIQRYQQTYKGNEDAQGLPIWLSSKDNKDEEYGYRASVQTVYDRIDADFLKAIPLLDGWKRPEKLNKVYIDKSVAAGLYARVCLVKNDWDNAAYYANMARQDYSVLTATEFATEGFNNINSKEWMWGGDIDAESSSVYASFFSHIGSYDSGYGGLGGYKKIDARLYSQMSFNDIRRSWFKVAGSGYSYTEQEQKFPNYTNLKFKKTNNWEGDYLYMRVSEMVLIEAEALARSGQEGPAADVLKELMKERDSSWNKTSVTGDEVYLQRRLELWGEGFANYDLLRLKKGVDRSYEGTNHLSGATYKIEPNSWYFLYKIPQREIDNNPDINEEDQNPTPIGK
ncbi:RagB/SusD family nutrient uptake outer membrane protein [Dysgonomonas sp. 216]|uniref:RagB/SusD family nutrient uptake outer membrane protein n=1 Tax=Dysgonomonas sp. 216 TaxID=2302934 RepID=UPI0013D449B9|nr:RagB/SusD family nutrient uptake outer membrane protein [Dysgonomonas sp. 216]NDW18880.1 RagB/SusD family nutrient uptake outer membrane protein [Dysgonomonas sp. 216]